MIKSAIIFVLVFVILNAQAQDYLIGFIGTGDTTVVGTVKVDNLMSGATVTLNAGDKLHLSAFVGLRELDKNNEAIHLYPNPMEGQAFLTFFAPVNDNVSISVTDVTGKTICLYSTLLTIGTHNFRISGVPQGLYIVKVSGKSYQYTAKLLSQSSGKYNAGIEYISTDRKSTDGLLKQTGTLIDMPYKPGDRLLFKGISGRYSTIVTDVPSGNKTVIFNFVKCTDADNNNYTTVTIGTQIWMAENLKTTKFNDRLSIPLVTSASDWTALKTPAYCWYNNDYANKNIYGALYNWYTVNTGKLGPVGWHVPLNDEWTKLLNFLGGENVAGGKLKETGTSHWNSPNTGATNSTGFTALPGGIHQPNGDFRDLGYLGYWWSVTEVNITSALARGFIWESEHINLINPYKSGGLNIRCVKDNESTLFIPTLITTAITNITQISAISGGNVTSDGGSFVTTRGVCWSTSPNPTTSGNKTTEGGGNGGFTSSIAGLSVGTVYYIRAYATNSVGTAYGNELVFTTQLGPEGTITDIEGNNYNTVTIGTQVWMTENLKTTKYNDGTSIPLVTDNTQWAALSTPGYSWYNNDISNKNPYGAMYNWYAVNTGKLAPAGWHVPTYTDWTVLATFLGGESVAGGKLKEAGTTHWLIPNLGATNESGFSALPGGFREGYVGVFASLGSLGTWYSATEYSASRAWSSGMFYLHERLDRSSSDGKTYGYSVRCVRDNGSTSDLPTVTTTSISDITQTSVTSGGNVTSDGGSIVTVRGVCWSTSPNPTASNNHTTEGSGTGAFTSNITGLSAGTLYYVRAYATNSAGTAYGDQRSFTTLTLLTVITTPVSGITQTEATGGGTVTSDGGARIIIRGVCWSTSPNPTTDNKSTNDGGGTGSFISTITGLSASTLYYVRAYAINNAGTVYGDQQTFTTLSLPVVTTTEITNVTQATASGGGNVISDGGATVTVKGVCWSTSPHPTTSNSKTTDGTGIGSFTSTISGLTSGTLYYVRAYATSNAGTAYGNEVNFTTLSMPTVTTTAVTSITQTTAYSGGNVTSYGSAAVTLRGVCWSTSPGPTVSGSKTLDGNGPGIFNSSISGLLPGTIYYVRAYATNSVGTAYGNEVSFTTLPIITITTKVATNITLTSAYSGGNVSSDGGFAVTVRGVCWSTSPNPNTSGNKTFDGGGTGVFTSSIAGLSSGTLYYVRAYATNSLGTAYGNEISFTTLSMPTVTTAAVTSITQSSAYSGGNVSSDGGSFVTSRGVCWSTSPGPSISNSKTNDGGGTGVFTSIISGLSSGTLYFVRAYATNSVGTAYGNEVILTTMPGPGDRVTDIDGNIYTTVTIGTQVWMVENLKTTRYNDGTSIPMVTSASEWAALSTPAYCWYNNDVSNKNPYGALYNWYAVNTGKLAPAGWHVPTDPELGRLYYYYLGNEFAGGKMKETGYIHWLSPNTGATNESGFTALPGGCRDCWNNDNRFTFMGVNGFWWSSTINDATSSLSILLFYNYAGVNGFFAKNWSGLSVRCLKN